MELIWNHKLPICGFKKINQLELKKDLEKINYIIEITLLSELIKKVKEIKTSFSWMKLCIGT